MRRKVWRLIPERPEQVAQVSARHGLPRLVARLLVNRGLVAEEELLAYLEPTLTRLSSPFDLPDLDAAAARLAQAVKRREPVLVYGDYDADGLTATALVAGFLTELGVPVSTYVPDRLTEGYGLNLPALERLAPRARLLVTVDCGISDREEVAWARRQGLEVIITDHHEVPEELPPAVAVVNPKRVPGHPFGLMAGVGVALLLTLGVRAELRRQGWFECRPEPNLRNALDLVALGTAADVVPVVGENRILVRQGLRVMEETRRPGLLALKEVAGLNGRHVSFRDLAFRLAPRLNAAGRLGQAGGALALLTAPEMGQARFQARELNQLNRRRQSLEDQVLQEAWQVIRTHGLARRPVIVAAGPGWHPGVLGIAAARLTEDLGRPVALVSLTGGRGRGSARSIPAFHLFAALTSCRHLLLKYGGHAAAAGFLVPEEHLTALQAGLEAAFEGQVGTEPPPPALEVDAEVHLQELDEEFFAHLELLRPFGPGNPEPVLVSRQVRCLDARVVNDRHLKLKLAQGDSIREVMFFDGAGQALKEGILEVAFSPRVGYFQGRLVPEYLLVDWSRLP